VKKDADHFEGRDAQLLFIARRLADAARVEALLTEAQVDYGVEADEYSGGVIFRRTRIGAFFYVLPEAWDEAVRVMSEAGFTVPRPS
jgi:hypothetical protein